MARNAIASGSAILTADADGLVGGFDRATRAADQWAAKTDVALKRTDARFRSGLGGLAGQLAKFGGKVVGGVGVGIGINIANSIKGVAHDAPAAILDALEDTAKKGQIAQALGLTAEEFTGVAGVAKSVGEDTREFLESLVTMGKLATDAANGVGEVAGPAFEKLRLDPAEFVTLKANEQFFRMFEALSKVDDRLTRVRLLMAAFGEDGGKYLLPLLGRAPADLRKMAEGFEISTAQVEKATAANLAWKKVEQTIGETVREVAVDVAPKIEEIAGDLVRHLKEVGPTLVTIAEAGAQLTKDVLIPGAAWAAEFTKGLLDVKAATAPGKPLHLPRSQGGGREGDTLDQLYDALPDASEWGAAARMAVAQQKDAWNKAVRDADTFGILGAMGLTHPSHFAEDEMKKLVPPAPAIQEPPRGVVSGWWVKAKAGVEAYNAELDKSRELARALVAGEAGPGASLAEAMGGMLGRAVRPDRAVAGAAAGELARFGTDLARAVFPGLGETGRQLETWREGFFRAGRNLPGFGGGAKAAAPDRPAFAGAIQAGSKEAYSIEVRQRYGTLGRPDDVHRENGRKLDGIKTELGTMRVGFEAFAQKVEGV